MSTFIINRGYDSEKTVEARGVTFVDEFIVFSEGEEIVYVRPKNTVHEIERVK